MSSFRTRVIGALGFAFLPLPWDLFHLVIPAAHAQTATQAKQTPRTWSRSPSIRLPVQIDERTRASLSEIKLFVKAPGLVSDWAVVHSGPPTQDSFDFRADKDGEYAFLFVTIDKAGRSSPGNLDARPPHQIILVDTTPPELSVQPLPVANREIYLQVRARDAHPELSTIKLEYQVGENSWKAMDLAQQDSPGVFRIPHAHVLEGKVRASAVDKAGNVGTRIVDLGDPTRPYNIVEKPREPKTLPTEVSKVETPDQRLTTGVIPAAPQTMSKTAPWPTNLVIPENQPVASKDSSTNLQATTGDAPVILDPKAGKIEVVLPPADRQPNTSAKMEDPYFPPIDVKAIPPKDNPGSLDIEIPSVDARPATDIKPTMEPKANPTPPATAALPIIGTNRCTLDYAVENVIIGGQTKIEFWATKDNGKSWIRIQDENGGRVPAKLVLPGDGVYGVRAKANTLSQPPQIGEAPDAWVEVDTTKPNVRLMPPSLGTGADIGTLTIHWAAQDKNLIADSINIYQASRPDGPWLPIATNLRNDGAFRWLIPPGIGAEVYLRLEATDRAGNLGQNDLRDPVAMPLPKIRVLGIGPAR